MKESRKEYLKQYREMFREHIREYNCKYWRSKRSKNWQKWVKPNIELR